jgi:ankyrin repeat protein
MINSKNLFFIALIGNIVITTILFKSKSISADIAEIDQIYNRSQNEFAGITALMSAVSYNDIEGVRFFTKNNPEIVNKRNLGGASALHIACREKNYEIAKILIENGADINIVDNEGWTPLMRVASMGDKKITELLVQNDARIDIVNNFSETAIVHSAIANCTQCLKAIIDNRLIAKNFELGNQSYENILKKELETVKTIAIKYDNVEMENFANEIEKQINELIEIRAKKYYEQEKIELAQASNQAIEQAIAANQNTNNQEYKNRLEINNNQVSDKENANKNDNNIQNINKINNNINIRSINDNINQDVSYQLVEKTENKTTKPTIIRINNEPINPTNNIVANQIAVINGSNQRNIDSKGKNQKNNTATSRNNVKNNNIRYYFNISKIAKIGDIAKQMQKSTMIAKQPIVNNVSNVNSINSIVNKGYYGNENYQQQNLGEKSPRIANINQSSELQKSAITKFRDNSRLIIESRQIKDGKTVIYKTIYKLDKFDNNHSKKLIRNKKK